MAKLMNDRHWTPLVLASALVSGALLVSCGSVPSESISGGGAPEANVATTGSAEPSSAIIDHAAPKADRSLANPMDSAAEPVDVAANSPQVNRPQLIRRAELRLVVDSIPDTLKQINTLLQKQGGDLLTSSIQQPNRPNQRRTASLTMRVPQERLDLVLADLATLGIVERQLVTAEDVSTQLVDMDARLKNLRRTEETLLKIMERSGSVGDVLNVARELSNVRQTIEQIDAQRNTLKNQVTFSTITLDLEEAAIAPLSRPRTVPLQLNETWINSTRSLKTVSVGLLSLGIWCLVYSPYIAILLGLLWLIRRHQKQTLPVNSSDQASSGS